MKREFFVVHSRGVESQVAENAAEALRKAAVGVREARAVVAAELLVRSFDSTAPFTAICGEPASPESEGGK